MLKVFTDTLSHTTFVNMNLAKKFVVKFKNKTHYTDINDILYTFKLTCNSGHNAYNNK